MSSIAAILRCDDRVVAPVYPVSRIIGARAALRWPLCLRDVLAYPIAHKMVIGNRVVDVVVPLLCV